jgi:DNA-binding CsgD family transcriptional regulator
MKDFPLDLDEYRSLLRPGATGSDRYRDLWATLYRDHDLSTRQIALHCDYSYRTVARQLQRAGITTDLGRSRQQTLKERFDDKVDRSDDCHLWKGSTDLNGYGKLNVGGETRGAHRLAYEWEHGDIPDGLMIDHKCNNKGCVNPDHLRLVTREENAVGAAPKLSQEAAEEIRTLSGRYTQKELAEEYGVTASAIGAIVRGESYANA